MTSTAGTAMQFRTQQIADVTKGSLLGDDVEVRGAGIDSRRILPGELFIAIDGNRDGHEFIDHALDRGAAAYLSRRTAGRGTGILVADTLEGLRQVGRAARSRMSDLVVGVTGSVGKTTVKELLRGALSPIGIVAASPASFNNELGVPLTLINVDDRARAVIVEMGARGRGHIRDLCHIAAPTVGVVTEVAGAHLELFETIEDVALAKRELVESLPPDGTAVLNADNPAVARMAGATDAQIVTFGLSEDADVTARDIELDDELRPRFDLRSPWGNSPVELSVRGRHQVTNALAAATVGVAQGLPVDAVAAGVSAVAAPEGRMSISRTSSGAVVIDDSYNANPTSMHAALQALSDLEVARRIAIVGVMAEMGETSPVAHRGVITAANELGIEVIVVGTDLYGIEPTEIRAVAERVGSLDESCAVLVKASRVAELERVIPLLR